MSDHVDKRHLHICKKTYGFCRTDKKINVSYAKQRHYETLLVCIHKAHQGKGLAAELIGYETCKGSMFHNPASPDRFLKKPAKYEFETLDVFQIL